MVAILENPQRITRLTPLADLLAACRAAEDSSQLLLSLDNAAKKTEKDEAK